MHCTRNVLAAGLLLLASPASTVFAQSAVLFSDVPASSPYFQAVEYLKEKGIVGGYSDGTYRPDAKVNRAEALKILLSNIAKPEDLKAETSVFSDVAPSAWYLPYVEVARTRGIIAGPPAKPSFFPEKPVTKMEFVKMLMLAYGVDPSAYGEIKLPLADDVTDPAAWYYPYLRYAISSSMTMIGTDGTLKPGAELTRGTTALLLHRYLMYKENRRTQALLSETESEILVVLSALENNDIVQAEYASARGLIAARGVHQSRPDLPIVQGALKIMEAFRTLVRGYRSGIEKQYDQVIQLAGDAWRLADSAKTINPELTTLGVKLQEIAKDMADGARALKTQ